MSTLPRTACTGARARRLSSTSGDPTSPAWTISSQPFSASIALSLSSPWVSEITPMIIDKPILQARSGEVTVTRTR